MSQSKPQSRDEAVVNKLADQINGVLGFNCLKGREREMLTIALTQHGVEQWNAGVEAAAIRGRDFNDLGSDFHLRIEDAIRSLKKPVASNG